MGRLLQKTFVQVFAKFFKPRTFDHCRGWIFNVMLIAAWPLILFPIDDRWMGGSWCSCVSPVVVPVIKDWVLANICEVVIDMVHCCTAVCILLEGELTSGTHAAAWILHLQSFLRNTTHSQRMLGRHFSFMDGVVVGVQRFSVGVPPVTATISSLLYPSGSSFLTTVLQGIWPSLFYCFLQPIFLPELHDLANLSLTHPLCFVPSVLLVVDCKVHCTTLFKFTSSAADRQTDMFLFGVLYKDSTLTTISK